MSNVVAFFDMDGTILRDSSGKLYMRYLWRQSGVDRVAMLRSYWYAALYRLGLLDYPAVAVKLALMAADSREEETRALCQRWFAEMGVQYIAEKAVQRMRQHSAQGHRVTIISASTPYVVEPLAAHLGVVDCLCTRLEVQGGRFTGKIIEPACFGPGKVHWAQVYSARHGTTLAQSFFYSDSHTDQSLLEAVGHPVAVNPDSQLAAVASRCGWPVEYFY
jgi:putative phosphoserine phosphatase/1-acylglycerol-3-phosphate O-acyltransferase